MFEHLDDPAPPSFGENFKSRVLTRGRTLRRRRRVAWVGATSVCAVVLGVVGLYGSALRTVDDAERVEVAGTGAPEGASVRTVLVAGSDARHDEALSGPTRTDTLIVLRFDQQTGRVATLPIPRDLVVTAPTGGEVVRINTVAASDGLSGLVNVVETQLAIPVDHVVSVDFEGFVRLVDLLGGVEIQVPGPVRDQMTGLYLDGPGCVDLDGTEALQLVRSRMLQTQVDGRWRTDPRGDLGRIDRLQVFLLAALDRLGGARPDPITANRLADWIVENVAVDETMDRQVIVGLAQVAVDLGPEDVDFGTLPVENTVIDEAAVLRLAEGADQLIEDFTEGVDVASGAEEIAIATCR